MREIGLWLSQFHFILLICWKVTYIVHIDIFLPYNPIFPKKRMILRNILNPGR